MSDARKPNAPPAPKQGGGAGGNKLGAAAAGHKEGGHKEGGHKEGGHKEAHASRRLVKDPVRYKTMMCANWARDGACPYGFKCQFAHGQAELRERPPKQQGKGGKGKGKASPTASPPSATPAAGLPIPAEPLPVAAGIAALSIAAPAASEGYPPLSGAAPAAPDAVHSKEPSPRHSCGSGGSSSRASFTERGETVAPLRSSDAAHDSALPTKVADAPIEDSDAGDGSGPQLVCNALTGEVEVALPPGAGRQVSHHTSSVRRQISMLFEEDSSASPPPPASAQVWGNGYPIIGAC